MLEYGTDATWTWSRETAAGWQTAADFDAAGWEAAAELGDVNAAPWNLAGFLGDVSSFTLRSSENRIRAVWTNNDALMTALGRPNRDIAVTHRDSPATMLQLLELTNGATVTKIMDEGGKRATTRPSDQVITDIYRRALGRAPNTNELDLARAMIGSPAKPEGVADLLWAIAMLPEFQLIY